MLGVGLRAGAQEQQLSHARTLALAAHYQQSIAVYDSVLATDPRDFEAGLGRAQVVAWSGQLPEAEREYRALIVAGAGADADKGLARVLAWRGQLAESERIYRAVVARDSMDTEGWTGVAQVLQWEGRPREAMVAIERGLAAHPDDGDARALWRGLRPLVSPSMRPSVTSGGDTEHNTNVNTTLAADALAPWNGRYTVAGGVNDAWRGLAHGTSAGGRVGATWADLGDRLTVGVAGGVATTNGTDVVARTVTTLAGSVRVSGRLAAPVTVGATVFAAPFDETAALIARGIRQASAGIDLAVTPPGVGGGRVEASGAYVGVGGGARDDDRIEGSAYVWSGAWRQLAVAVGSHGYGYLRDDTVDGYFTPASFVLGEGVVRWATDRDGWNGSAEGGVGAQRIAAFGAPASTRPAYRVQGAISYRVAPGIEYGVSGGYALAASPEATTAQAAGNYRGYSVGVTARIIP